MNFINESKNWLKKLNQKYVPISLYNDIFVLKIIKNTIFLLQLNLLIFSNLLIKVQVSLARWVQVQ